MKTFLSAIALLSFVITNAQYDFRAIIKHDDAPLSGATVLIKELGKTGVTDTSGLIVIKQVPAGKYTIEVSYTGMHEYSKQMTIPLKEDQTVEIFLEPEEEEEEEVIIHSTRTSRTISNIPTRVETIAGEEVDEKSNMRPSNVSMLLHESTGIQVQQTSATSSSASIRIQGLDGRYTQLLKDGFPSFGGFSGGLSVLEIPPLDLQQVEIIKGPASTLYGGGAIAGVVNFITIEPGKNNYTKFLLNQSHIGQTNLAVFITQHSGKMGFTMLGTANRQKAYDVDDDEFTEIPKTLDFTFAPKLFFYPNDRTKISFGHSITTGDRRGGDIFVVNGKADASHVYFENNKTIRNSTTFEFNKKIRENHLFTAKQSFNMFDRKIELPGYGFKGTQINTYTDISYLRNSKQHVFITGLNFIYDHFDENMNYSGVERNDKNITAGAYIQDTWDASEKLSFENGLRLDVTDRYGAFILPRISVLYKITNEVSSRIGAGIGYKLPTLFTEETETIQYRNVLAPDNSLKAEKSYGATADVNFRKKIAGDLEFSLNQMFFYTMIRRPLILQDDVNGIYFLNADRSTRSYGFETNMKFIYQHAWKLFAGYTHNETAAKWKTGNQFLPLVPKGKLNLALIYEKHDFLKVGLEGYRTGEQFLSNGDKTPAYWELGFMVEKPVGKFSFYINFENFLDERQSKYKRVVNGPHNDPTFDEIWNHTEGFVVNGGMKFRIDD